MLTVKTFIDEYVVVSNCKIRKIDKFMEKTVLFWLYGCMKTERKYLDEFEMSLLEKYGIKILKKKYDVSDLLDMLPKKWKEGNKRDRNESWNGIRIEYDYGMSEWTCTTPHWFYGGACGVVTWNIVRGDTLVECLLRAVLTLAGKGDRRYLKKTYVVEDWKYSET